MERRTFMALASGGLLAVPLTAQAQQPSKVWRIGFLSPLSRSETDRQDGFRQGMRETGHVEGKDFVIEGRFAEGQYQRIPGLAEELVRMKVDVIVVWGTPASIAIAQATSTLPIVILSVTDPVGSGLVASLARPGRNITGVSNLSRDLSGKLLELLVQVVPGISRIAALRNPLNPGSALHLNETETAARELGLELQLVEARAPEDLAGAFAAIRRGRARGVVVLTDAMFIGQRHRIAELATKSRLPTVFARRENAEGGGLMSYGPSLSGQFLRAATYVDKILKGARPADLPIEQPTKFELVINLKTAKALGLTIPQSLLQRADEVIQ
jgi:putative tryptophan/tyrosine transport system substrate-binding protein